MVNEPTLIHFKEQVLSTLKFFFAKKNFASGIWRERFDTATIFISLGAPAPAGSLRSAWHCQTADETSALPGMQSASMRASWLVAARRARVLSSALACRQTSQHNPPRKLLL